MAIQTGYLLLITNDRIGATNPELGSMLMGKFLRSLGTSLILPEQIVLMNDGIRLAMSGSSSLDMLKALAGRGVAIRSCGTCLNFLHMADSLAVGEVGTMDAAVEALGAATRVVTL